MPGRVHRDQITPLLFSVIDGISHALPTVRPDGKVIPGDLMPGSQAMRDLEKAAGFLGASMAAQGSSAFDVAAALVCLRNVLLGLASAADERDIHRVFEWLQVLALDAFATAKTASAEERLREQLEKGTPVVLVAPMVPAALLVGAPDSLALDTIFSRLLLLTVRVGAPAVIVDASGLLEPASQSMQDALHRFSSHRKVSGKREVIGVGLTQDQAMVWSDVLASAGVGFVREDQFMTAVTRALERAGHELRPRS